jgi:hypothetical protein
VDQFHQESTTLQEIVTMKAQIEAGIAGKAWAVVNGIVVHDGRIFMPASSKLWPVVLEHAHGMGHEGVQKTLTRLRSFFFTPGDNKLVRNFIRGCSVCQGNKTEHLHPVGLLQPLTVPDAVWTDIAMDFIEGFPKVGGNSVVLTVVDRFSKYDHFITLGHPYSATTVATAFFTNIIHLHGFPSSIVSDCDPVFTSRVWQEMFKLSSTQLCLSSAFRPQTDGQSEVTNRVIVMYLCCLADDQSWSWLPWLLWAEYCFNTSYQTALGTTPFQVVYGQPPPPIVPFQSGATKVSAVDRQLWDHDTFLAEIREHLLQAHARMKMAHDKGHHHVEFALGDLVWLCLNQCATASVRDNARTKLAPKFFRPYEVIEQIGSVTYKLRLPGKARIHNVFHIAFLKKFEGLAPQNTPPLPHIVRGLPCLLRRR